MELPAADATFTGGGDFCGEKEWNATATVNALSTQTLDFRETPIQANLKVTGAPSSARYNYPQMAHYFAFFKSWEHCEKVQKIPGSSVAKFDRGCLINSISCCVTQTEIGMTAWAAGTRDFTDMNGKMDALMTLAVKASTHPSSTRSHPEIDFLMNSPHGCSVYDC